jgi:hypothetical protein
MAGSKHLSAAQLHGLRKVGDILIPGDGRFPSFSASAAIEHVDRMADHMSPSDRDGVKFLCTVFRILPSALVRAIMALTEQQRYLPSFLGTPCRLVNIGIKGVVMSLYYSDLGSGPSIHALLDYDAKIVEPDAEGSAAPGGAA